MIKMSNDIKNQELIVTNDPRAELSGISFSPRYTQKPNVTEIQNTGFWFMPTTGIFHKEESLENVRNDVPVVTHEILNIYEQREVENQIKQSGNIDGYSGNGGWSDEYYPTALLIEAEKNAALKAGHRKTGFEIIDGLRQSGKITSDLFANVKSTVLASRVVGISPIDHVLKSLITTNRVDRIDQKYYKFNAPDNQVQDMGYFNIPEGTIGAYVEDTSAIAPYGWTYGVTEDYYMQPYDVDPLGDLTRLLPSRVALFENKKIATAINAIAADTGGASFTAKTSGVYTNNAYDIIYAKIAAIGALERANPTTLISQRVHLLDYLRNQSDRYDYAAQVTGPAGLFSGIQTNVTNLGGVRWGFDNLITTNQLTILDPTWFYYNEGPSRLSTVVNNLTNVRQTMFKKWGAVKILTFGISAAGSFEGFRKIDTIA